MTLAQLRYFCTAAQSHSITKASQMLNVTQPTVSIAIRDLEREFSVELMGHSGNRLTLTPEGETFYKKAMEILITCEDLRSDFTSKGRGGVGRRVRLGIPPMLSTIFFPEMLDMFHKDHPDTWIELEEFGSARAAELVQDEVLDIGLVNMEMPNIDKFQSLELLNDPISFFVSASHPMAELRSLEFERLDGEAVILFNRDSVHNRLLRARFDALSVSPKIIMHSSQITTILRFLRRGDCGCFFYRKMAPLFPEPVEIPMVPEINTRIKLMGSGLFA